MSHVIPSFHFVHPDKKLTPEWCKEANTYCYYNTNNITLLDGKDVDEIEEFASGKIKMAPFKRMFTSLRKAMKKSKGMNGEDRMLKDIDKTGLSWEPLPLIPHRLNSAIATVAKIPLEVSCVAQDGLAMKKRSEDLEFLQNKPLIEEDLQDLADKMEIGKVDIGSTKHSAQKYSSTPMGLDLNDEDEKSIFTQLVYSLGVETSNEKVLQQFMHLKKIAQTRHLEIIDQFKFGVSVNSGYRSAITQLLDAEYIYPGQVRCPKSRLPDYSDTPHRIIEKQMTVIDMINFFGSEINGEKHLEKIVNGEGGYCDCNKGVGKSIHRNDWGTQKLTFMVVEVKSVDWIGIAAKKSGRKSLTTEGDVTERLWAQNTYRYWWLINTDYFFGIERLPWSHREKGHESYQNFSTNIYKSQEKSAVELSIGENKKAQIADIKMEHALIMSLPPGQYIDLRFLRGAIEGLKDENSDYTLQELIDMKLERNIMIGDTSGFEGAHDHQLKPFIDIPGGLKQEVAGYIQVILNADRNIAGFTGINEQLTGQAANPEGLVGLQKLLINSSINAIYYCNIALESQYQSLANLWANMIQICIEAGGKTKQAIIDMIGVKDVELLDGLNQTPLHNLTIKVLIVQRELERQNYAIKLSQLQQKGIISVADEYVLSGIENPKERFAYLAIKEKRAAKREAEIRQEQFAQQQQLLQQQSQGQMEVVQSQGQQRMQEIYAKADAEAKIMQLAGQLGLNQMQAEMLAKRVLQKDRSIDQKDKGIAVMREKQNMKQQEALV